MVIRNQPSSARPVKQASTPTAAAASAAAKAATPPPAAAAASTQASAGWKPGPAAARPEVASSAVKNTAFNFDPAAKGYTAKNAYALGQISNATYLSETDQKAQLAKWGYDSVTTLSEKIELGAFDLGIKWRDSQGFVAGGKDAIQVSFRGTEQSTIADWITDAAAIFRVANGKDGAMHRGFVDAFSLVKKPMMEAIIAEWKKDKEAGRPLRPVFFSGHSLGGALATLAAKEVQENLSEWKQLGAGFDGSIGGVYTYGAPKVGSPDFAKYYDTTLGLADKTFRHVNNNDRVPQTPGGLGRLKKWTHVAAQNERYLGSNGKVLVGTTDKDPARAADMKAGRSESFQRLKNGALNGDFSNPLTDGLNDHLMDNYMKALEAQLK